MDDAELMVVRLSEFVNNYGCDVKGFANAIMREHRTLQQSMFRLFIKTISEWAKLSELQYDLRNEYTVQSSKKIMKVLEGFGTVPFV